MIFSTNHCLFIPNLHEKNIEITIDNIHNEKMSQLFNFTEAELVNQGKHSNPANTIVYLVKQMHNQNKYFRNDLYIIRKLHLSQPVKLKKFF